MATYRVVKTSRIQELLTQVEVNKRVIEALPGTKKISLHQIHTSLLHSSLFSARIEGNPLTTEDLTKHSLHLKEIQQLAAVYTDLLNHDLKLSIDFIKELHRKALKGIVAKAGTFRTEQTAIFDTAGNAIYLTPPASDILPKLKQLMAFYTTNPEHGLIKTVICHYLFEKIHPFVDGNGRVGRLLLFWMLKKESYHFKGLLNLEEALEANRSDYYASLNKTSQEMTEVVEFFLELLVEQARKVIAAVSEDHGDDPETRLLPRRREILALIKDHQEVSFDFIRRRFLAVKPSTLHYDLTQLMKHGLIDKVGSTRGVLYRTH